jgi:hypothetical protein
VVSRWENDRVRAVNQSFSGKTLNASFLSATASMVNYSFSICLKYEDLFAMQNARS